MPSSFSGLASNFEVGGMRALHCVDSATTDTITGATAANPVVITATAHGLTDGDRVRITGVVGMTELNGRDFMIANSDANTFELSGEDGTGHTAYSSGGTSTLITVTDLGYTAEGSQLTIEKVMRDRLGDQDGQSVLDKVQIGEKVSLSLGLLEVTGTQLQKLFPDAGVKDAGRVESGGALAASTLASANDFMLILHPLDDTDTDISGEWAIFSAVVVGQVNNPLGHSVDQVLNLTLEGMLDSARPRTQRLWRYGS